MDSARGQRCFLPLGVIFEVVCVNNRGMGVDIGCVRHFKMKRHYLFS